jgi:hypothetical protein
MTQKRKGAKGQRRDQRPELRKAGPEHEENVRRFVLKSNSDVIAYVGQRPTRDGLRAKAGALA